jgi:hypothetical protein
MKSSRRHSLCLLILALPLIGVGCATQQNAASMLFVQSPKTQPAVSAAAPKSPMTTRQARKTLTEALVDASMSKAHRGLNFESVKFRQEAFTFIAKGRGRTSQEYVIAYADLNNLSLKALPAMWSPIPQGVVLSGGKPLALGSRNATFPIEMATKFYEALLVLRKDSLEPTEDVDFAAFSLSAKTWLAASPRPVMSDEALTYKAVAEEAFERKDYPAALNAYCVALTKHTTWPEGHYNAALLAADAEDFELAAKHMRRYLVLAPDAKDAAAAKSKFLLWQHKAQE